MSNTWYVATLIMRCIVGNNHQGPVTCDEQIRVIHATDDNEAYEKAVRLGAQQQDVYQNSYGEPVSWEFVGLANLEELLADAILDGTEIRGRIFSADDPAKIVRQRDDLNVFWGQRNKHRTAASIIDEADTPDER